MTPKVSHHSLRIDWSDIDAFGHVNNVAILRFVQSARVTLWETTGVLPSTSHGLLPMLASTACRFMVPLRYPGTVTLRTTISFI